MKDIIKNELSNLTDWEQGVGNILRQNNFEEFLNNVSGRIKDIQEELHVTNKLLSERQKVLDAIPECKDHGSCVPHALEWIEKHKNNIKD